MLTDIAYKGVYMKKIALVFLVNALVFGYTLALASCGGGGDTGTPGSTPGGEEPGINPPGGEEPGVNPPGGPSGAFDPNKLIGKWVKDGNPNITVTYINYRPDAYGYDILGMIDQTFKNPMMEASGDILVRSNGILSGSSQADYTASRLYYQTAFEGAKLRISGHWYEGNGQRYTDFNGLYTKQ